MDDIFPNEIWSLILGEFCTVQHLALMELCSKSLFRSNNLWGHLRHLKLKGDHLERAQVFERLHWDGLKSLVMDKCEDLIPKVISKLNEKVLERLEIRQGRFIPSQMMPALRVLKVDAELPAKKILESVVSFCPKISWLTIWDTSVGSSDAVKLARQLVQQHQFKLLHVKKVSPKLRSILTPQETAKVLVETGPLCLPSDDAASPSSVKAFYMHALSADMISSGAGTYLLAGWPEELDPPHVAPVNSALNDPEVIDIFKSQICGKSLPVHYPALLLHLAKILAVSTQKKLEAPATNLVNHLLRSSNRPLNHLVHAVSFNLDVFGPFLTRVAAGEVALEVDFSDFLFPEIHTRWDSQYCFLHWVLQDEERTLSAESGIHLIEHAAYFGQLTVLEALLDRAKKDMPLRKSIYQHLVVRDTLKWIDNVKSWMITEEEGEAYEAVIEHLLEQSRAEGITITKKDVYWIGMVAPFFGKMNLSDY